MSISNFPLIRVQSIILASIWLPIITSTANLVGEIKVGFIFKSILATLAILCFISNISSIKAKLIIFFFVFFFLLHNIYHLGLLTGFISYSAGIIAYSYLLYPIGKFTWLEKNSTTIVRHGIVCILIILAFGIFFGRERLVHDFANPNTIGIMLAGLLLFSLYHTNNHKIHLLLACISLAILVPLQSRSAILIVLCIVIARFIAALRIKKHVIFYGIILIASVITSIYVFKARGDFIDQQLDEGGRVNIAWSAIEKMEPKHFILGKGFGLATNGFTNYKLHIDKSTAIQLQKKDTFFGGLDNTVVASMVNGGVIFTAFILFSFFGWLINRPRRKISNYFESIMLCGAIATPLTALNLPEVWPGCILMLIALWTPSNYTASNSLTINENA